MTDEELSRLLDEYRDAVVADECVRDSFGVRIGAREWVAAARAAIIAAWEGREDARDAARYRWLRDKSANSVNGPFVMSAEPGRWGWIEGDKTDLEVDAAIAATAIKAAIAQVDAARTEGKGNG